MKNRIFIITLSLLAVSSFAQDLQNRYIFIEGTAERPDQLDFFRSSFVMEANSSGYVVTGNKNEAAHTLGFTVTANNVPQEEYVISMSLYRNEDNAQLVSFDFAFASLDEMYPFIRTLFLNSVTNIPLPLLTEDYLGKQWDKWIYFRASFDSPVTFYVLQGDGLKGGIGLFNTDPPMVSPIGHEIMMMPGATLGAEFQFLNFLSLELNFQMSMGDTRDNYFVNMGAGAELKFPVKFRNIMLVPYGAFTYYFTASPIFSEFPPFAVGGGIQFCARAGKRGILFLDTKYMLSFSDAVMRNPYLDFPEKERLYPEPEVIHYKRSYLGIGIGYKIGIIDKKKNTATIVF